MPKPKIIRTATHTSPISHVLKQFTDFIHIYTNNVLFIAFVRIATFTSHQTIRCLEQTNENAYLKKNVILQ